MSGHSNRMMLTLPERMGAMVRERLSANHKRAPDHETDQRSHRGQPLPAHMALLVFEAVCPNFQSFGHSAT